jgi:formylglycine-generating enzyme required for sulfatase activity
MDSESYEHGYADRSAPRFVVGFAVALVMLVVAGRGVLRDVGGPYWTDTVTGMRFVMIRPGTFEMGTPPDEDKREEQEKLHRVHLTRPYLIGQYEVTQAEWRHVMGRNPSFFRNCDRCPVEQVSWLDVQEFLARLNQLSQPGFRLPTEAEWEFACRAGGPHPFGTRDTLGSDDANINGNFPYNAPAGLFLQRTTPVGSFTASDWGLFDMSGNVWEWVQDEHCPYAEGTSSDPVGTCGSPRRVIRGGSWRFDGGSARCGLRYTHRPQDKGDSLGVRLVRDPVR